MKPSKLLVFGALACIAISHLGRAAAPPACYVAQNGTVYDARTKLTWQREVDAQSYTWAAAKTYCQALGFDGGGWRLPTFMELQTIIDDSRSDPSINPVAFPCTPSWYYWTSSSASGRPNSAWLVDFQSGNMNSDDVMNAFRVRCVR